jgi:hypothetical protein
MYGAMRPNQGATSGKSQLKESYPLLSRNKTQAAGEN